jgi:hypothetical protein
VGKNFDFDGWPKGETPVELFDQARWPECLHATIQALNVLGDPAATQAAVTDTGLLHELSHLACVVDIWTHHNMADLRQQIAHLSQGGVGADT